MRRGVAQMVAYVVWDHGVAGSNPVTPTKDVVDFDIKSTTSFYVQFDCFSPDMQKTHAIKQKYYTSHIPHP